MLAAMIDGLAESGANEGAGAAGVRRDGSEDDAGREERHQPRLGHVDRRRCAGATWGCCCRCRAPGARQLGDRRPSPTTSRTSASTASGPRWRSPSPAAAPTRRTSRPPPSSTATSGSSTARRSSSPPASRADGVVVWATLDKTRPRRRSSRSWSRRARPACASSGSSTSSASAPPTPRRSSSTTAGPAGRTCSAATRSTPSRASPGAMATFDNTRPLVAAMAIGCARAALDLTRELLARRRRRDRLRPAGATTQSAAAREVPPDGGRPARRARLLMLQARLDGRQPQAQLARGRRWPRRRPAASAPTSRCRCVELLRCRRLQRDRAAREVVARLQDPRHLRGHPADPAADRRPPGAGAVEHRAQVSQSGDPLDVLGALEVGDAEEDGVDAEVGQATPAVALARRPCRRGCARRTPRRRSGRAAARPCAQVSSRSVPIVGRSRTVIRTVVGVPAQRGDVLVQLGRAEGTLAASPSVAAIRSSALPGPAHDHRDRRPPAAGSRSSRAG